MLARVDYEFSDDLRIRPAARARSGVRKWCVLALILVPIVLFLQLVVAGVTEGYCIVWPSIGTRFADGYSHSGFAAVRPGMTRAEVERILGKPLGTSITFRTPRGFDEQRLPGDEEWHYSGDSSARGGDWAWLSREVVFRGGVVHHTHAWVFHD